MRGCLLGVAVGDALGAAVEFVTLGEIRARFGPAGLRDYQPACGRLGAITDDTQMTLFTAEGLLRAEVRGRERGITDRVGMVDYAYAHWLATQDERSGRWKSAGFDDGWLVKVPALHTRRAPGTTCLSALRGPTKGTPERPVNDSKGCGGVMRVAPAGLIGARDPFDLGARLAAITHGHPSGYLSAGFYTALIAEILAGAGLTQAIARARERLRAWPRHEECLRAVDAAVSLARRGAPSPEQVERLGGGWTGEEALAVALYCASVAPSFPEAVLLAVNHSGDSDSTGCLVGGLLGALGGPGVIPAVWLDRLELRDVVEAVAADLVRHFGPGDPDDQGRYPGC